MVWQLPVMPVAPVMTRPAPMPAKGKRKARPATIVVRLIVAVARVVIVVRPTIVAVISWPTPVAVVMAVVVVMAPTAVPIPMVTVVVMGLRRGRNRGGAEANRTDEESLEYIHVDCEVSLLTWTGLNAALFNILNRIKCPGCVFLESARSRGSKAVVPAPSQIQSLKRKT